MIDLQTNQKSLPNEPLLAHSEQAAAVQEPAAAIAALAGRIKSGRAILCIGSRLGNDGFSELLRKLSDSLGEAERGQVAPYIRTRPFWAAGYIKRKLAGRFFEELTRTWQFGADQAVLAKLTRLPFRATITTALAGDLGAATADSRPTYTPKDAARLAENGRSPFVLRVRGDLTRAETLVWGADDIEHLLADDGFRAVAQALLQTRSLLLVGFAPDDPELSLMTERIFAGAFRAEVEHFAVFSAVSAVEREELFSAYRVHAFTTSDLVAFGSTLEQAVAIAPGSLRPDADDLEAWLDLARQEEERGDALDALLRMEERFVAAGAHDKLVDLYLGRVDLAAQGPARAEMLGKVARLFEKELSDPGRALTALLAAYCEDPRRETWMELERIAQSSGLWADLVKHAAESIADLAPEHQQQTWLELAKISSDRLGNVEYALFAAGKVLSVDAKHPEARAVKRRDLRRAQKWPELMAFLEEEASDVSDSALRATLYTELSALYEIHEPGSAKIVDFAEQAHRHDESSQTVAIRLENLLRTRAQWKELVPLLEKRLQYSDAEEQLILRREIAAIYSDRLADRMGAIEKYEALRTLAPRDVEVLRTLGRLYREEGLYEQQLAMMAEEAKWIDSERGRADLWRQIASEWELHPDGATKAANAWERYLELSPRAEEAFGALERIHWMEKDWLKLGAVYERHAELTSGAVRAELLVRAGDLYEGELGDANRALAVFERALESEPQNSVALGALARLSVSKGQVDKAAQYFERQVELEESAQKKVEHLYQWGRLLSGKMGDTKKAETVFSRLLEVDPRHSQATTALVELYRERGEFLRAAHLLEAAAPHVQNRLDRTRFLVEAGEIYEGLDEKKHAAALYQETLAIDAEHVEAAERLADLLWNNRQYQELLPLLEMVTRRAKGRDAGEGLATAQELKWLGRLGKAAFRLGQHDKAANAFSAALAIDPQHAEAQKGLGEVRFALGDWDQAIAVLSPLARAELFSGPQKTELFYHLGVAELRRGRRNESGSWLTQAQAQDPSHRATLLALVELGSGEPIALIEAKKALLPTASEDEQVTLLTEIGDLYLERLEDPPQAVGAYQEALRLQPTNHKALHRCLDVYVEQKQWDAALAILERLTQDESNPTVRSRYRFTKALIYRDELSDSVQALACLQAALDDDAKFERALEAAEGLLQASGEIKELARLYRKMLKAVGAGDPARDDGKNAERLRLWSHLGELCLQSLGETESGIAAYEAALSFDANNLGRYKTLADLYQTCGGSYAEQAIVTQQTIVRQEKSRIVSYRSLRTLYADTARPAKATACSAALVLLRQGDAEDQAAIHRAKAAMPASPIGAARHKLTDEAWSLLAHPAEELPLRTLFSIVLPLVAPAQAQTYKALELQKKEAIGKSDTHPIARMIRYVAATLNVPMPEIYLRDRQSEAMVIAHVGEKQASGPAAIIGEPLLRSDRNERELMFEVTKRLALLRPERYVRIVLPHPAQVAQLLEAAVAISGGQGEVSRDVERVVQGFKRVLNPAQLEQLGQVGQSLRGHFVQSLALAWFQATDLTAMRAGYLLTGDLEIAARLVAADPSSATTLPPTQRLLELIWSSITEEVFTVRKMIGLM